MKLTCLSWLLIQLIIHSKGQTWHEFEGHCYTILPVVNNFNACKLSCRQYGSYTVELEGRTELEFVQTLIKDSSDQYWVGLDYNNLTEKFYWDRNGQEPLSSMWHSDEPNLSGACVRLSARAEGEDESGASFLLGDSSCTTHHKVICEKNTDMEEQVPFRELRVSSKNRCPITRNVTRSWDHCANNCRRNKECRGFQYDAISQSCTLFRFKVRCHEALQETLTMNVMEYTRC